MNRSVVRALCAGLAAGGLGCAGADVSDAPAPDPSFGVQLAGSESVEGFHSRATLFYARLAQRRFNTLDTYQDENLRSHFRGEAAFADYYADLAQALFDADFERNRPLSLDVVEFSFEAPGRARVHLRLVGEDARPLRSGEARLERVDRWERVDGRWWLVPGKL